MAKRLLGILLISVLCYGLNAQVPNFDSILKTIPKVEDKYRYCHKAIGDYQNLNAATALDLSQKELKFARILNDKRKIAASYNDIGNQYLDFSNYSEALNNFIESSKYYSEINDSSGIADEYNNIALIYSNKKDFVTTKRFLFKALAIHKIRNQKEDYEFTLMSIADAYRETGDIDSAFICYKYVINNSKDSSQLSIVYNNMALHFLDNNQLDSALNLFIASRKYNNTNLFNNAINENNIAECYYRMGNKPKALKGYLKALMLDQELGNPELIMTTCGGLADYYKAIGKFDSAFFYLNWYANLTDSLHETNTELELADYKSGYDRAAKEKELQIQTLENEKKEQEKKDLAIIFLISAVSLVCIIVIAISRYKSKQKSYDSLKVLNDEVTHQKTLVEEKQKEILDSITYAQRIQKPLLAKEDLILQYFTDCFVLFKPKDIVSGDFYWLTEKNDKLFLAVCDSTGHGVPGAFMSLLNIGFLSEAIKEKSITEPNEVFNYVRQRLIESISNEGQKDGFDGVLICYDKKSSRVYYSAAHCTPLLIRNDEMVELMWDKMPVGKGERNDSFTLHGFDVIPGDRVYLYTDGFADQFGGPKGKKFKYKQMKEVLMSEYINKMSKQKLVIEEIFEEWRGDLEQTDDVTIIGLKI